VKWCGRCGRSTATASTTARPAASLLEPFVLSKERKAEIPIIGDPDDLTLACIKAFYNGIAVLIEKECGLDGCHPGAI
jgi:probable nitrogen fixation protein